MRTLTERMAPGQTLGARHLNAIEDGMAAAALTSDGASRTTRGSFLSRFTSFVSAVDTAKRPFDLADKAATTFSVMDQTGRTKGVAVVGIWRTVTDGAGLTWDEATKWTSAVQSAACYVYIKIDREAPTAPSIIIGASLPDGTDTVEYHPLWYIPFADGALTWADVVDMRAAIRLPAMA